MDDLILLVISYNCCQLKDCGVGVSGYKPELWFCTGSKSAFNVSEIRDDEDLWQCSWLEIRLNVFHRSTIQHEQFIILTIIFMTESITQPKPFLRNFCLFDLIIIWIDLGISSIPFSIVSAFINNCFCFLLLSTFPIFLNSKLMLLRA